MRKNRNLPRGDVRRLEIESRVLAGNLLGDPTHRDLYVYLPPGFLPGDHPPLLVDLVGFTGSAAVTKTIGTFSVAALATTAAAAPSAMMTAAS